MNMGYEDDELKPYQEAQPDLNDQKRIGKTGTVQQQQYIHFTPVKVMIWVETLRTGILRISGVAMFQLIFARFSPRLIFELAHFCSSFS